MEKDKVIEKIEKVLPKELQEMKMVQMNTDGHTNDSYCVTTKDGNKYQVKFIKYHALKNLKTKIEFNAAMELYKYIFVDYKKGVSIRHWIDGKALPAYCKLKDKIDWQQIFTHLKKTHALPVEKFTKIKPLDLFEHSKNLKHLPKQYVNKYIELAVKYEYEPLCVSKIDMIPCNIIVDKKKEYNFIDNEWVALANEYWDYGELLRWVKYKWDKIKLHKYIKNLNMKKLREFNYMSYVYNYTWTFDMPQKKGEKTQYQKELLEGIKKTYLTID